MSETSEIRTFTSRFDVFVLFFSSSVDLNLSQTLSDANVR